MGNHKNVKKRINRFKRKFIKMKKQILTVRVLRLLINAGMMPKLNDLKLKK